MKIVLRSDIMQRADVRMVQRRYSACFLLKSFLQSFVLRKDEAAKL